MISLQLLSVFIIFAWIYFLWSRRSYYALMLKVPGPKGYPLIGSILDIFPKEGERDLSTDLAQFSLRIARQTTMGNDVDEEPSSKKDSFIHSIEYVLDTLTTMVCAPWLQINLVRKLTGLNDSIKEAKSNIDRTLCKLIDFKLDTNDNSETDYNKPSIFIDHALVHLKNGSLTYQSVIDQSLHILAAAYETSAEAVLFTLILLAMYPEYQEKLFEELYELYPHAGDFDVTYEDIQSLDYLNRVLNESMRLIPPLPLIGRQTSEDFMLSNGVLVPKGTNLFICIVHIHHSKEIWGPDAERFNPDNFLPENIQAKHQYSFIPFGKGTRGCIGWQYAYISTKTTLIKLLRNYKFSTKFRFEDLVLFTNVTMKLKEVPLLTLEKRNK
ncbi:uncharacterized protein Dwil_GK26994 [Drosophila willistoni]|uniref:Cytochrome P450 n=1 Tax=Drosophila willistoni TaxID=7260 RepID=A0A0Q9WSR8_DROWI|nr:uncharacterized protein Dwil_GK26994 [Drosophila willistoni]